MTLTADDLAALIRNAVTWQDVDRAAKAAGVSRHTIERWRAGAGLATAVGYLRALESVGLVVVVRRPAERATRHICTPKD